MGVSYYFKERRVRHLERWSRSAPGSACEYDALWLRLREVFYVCIVASPSQKAFKVGTIPVARIMI